MSEKFVKVGKVQIGGGAPISIQSMCNTDTRDADACLRQIDALAEAGCQIIRLAVPDMDAAKSFGEIKKRSPIPMVADIHFDYKLAIAAMENGADKVRINPGNIGSLERTAAVLEKAKFCGIPVRIGVNSGSLEKELLKKHGGVTAEALVESALASQKLCEELNFSDTVISIKSADVEMNHKAHKLLSESTDRPIHIGLTESGVGADAELKSVAALSALILDGIGDTMRVSLTGDPVNEVILANKILKACGKTKLGIDFVSCPTCGRTRVDLPSIADSLKRELAPVSERLEKEGRFLRIAVMGCEVNGPGEAKSADLGVACGPGIGLLFKNGEIVSKVDEKDIASELMKLI